MNPLPRLFLIPGWAHDSSSMDGLRKQLEMAADVAAFSTGDLWSTGKQARPPSAYAQNLVKRIEKKGGPAFLAGWSLGGMICLETAIQRPDLVSGLVMISSTAKFRADLDWTPGVSGGALRAMTSMLSRDPRGVFAAFFKDVALTFEEKTRQAAPGAGKHGTPWQRLEESIALNIERASAMNPLELSAGLQYLSETDLRSDAARLDVPALILHGRQDLIITVEAGLALQKMLANSGMRVYANYGHALPLQNPGDIARDIMGFMEECRNRNKKHIRS